MKERSEEEQPPKLKTYVLEMTLIMLLRDYTTYSTCALSAASLSPPRYPLLTKLKPTERRRALLISFKYYGALCFAFTDDV
jgi:hypothetical protein